MTLGPLYVLLVEVSIKILCTLFNWIGCLPGVESCKFFIYFGDQTLDQDIMGISIVLLFSVAMEKLFNLMKSHLFILSFLSLALGDMSVKMLLCEMSEIFLPMFSSRTFMVL